VRGRSWHPWQSRKPASGWSTASSPTLAEHRHVEPDAIYREGFAVAAQIVDSIERIKELIAEEAETIKLKDGRLIMHPGICDPAAAGRVGEGAQFDEPERAGGEGSEEAGGGQCSLVFAQRDQGEVRSRLMGVRTIDSAALIISRLWEWLWRERIHDFEHDTRAPASIMACSALALRRRIGSDWSPGWPNSKPESIPRVKDSRRERP
jgi:hypothetical protein